MACRSFIGIIQGDDVIDLSYHLQVTSAEIDAGISRTIEYEISAPGETPVEVARASIDLPSGWVDTAANDDGLSIRLRGKGAFNRDRTMRGDLLVYLEEEP